LLSSEGHEVLRLVRQARAAATEIEWHPEKGVIDKERLEERFDAVVHLAGENIAAGRWTDEKKHAIRESRVKGTALLSETLASLRNPPPVFVSASAIG